MILTEDKRKKNQPVPPMGGTAGLLAEACYKALKDGDPQRFAGLLSKLVELEIMKMESHED